MKGLISNYVGSHKTKKQNFVIVLAEGVKDRAAAVKLVGRKVSLTEWKKIGVIVAPHGDNGALRVRFSSGVPGQALGREVEFV